MKSDAIEVFNVLESYEEWLFDLDNTLIRQSQYDKYVFLKIEEVLLFRGHYCEGIAASLLEHKINKGPYYNRLFNDVIGLYGLPAALVEEMIYIYLKFRPQVKLTCLLSPYLAAYAKEKKLFIVTNGVPEIQRYKVSCLDIGDIFDEVVCCDSESELQLKPNVWAYEKLNSKYRLEKPIFVGDSLDIDGQFAKNSNMDFINFGVKYGY